MSVGPDHTQRRALTFLAGVLLAPRAARDWLALVDKLDPGPRWKAAGERFQRATAPALWVETLKRDREPRGDLVQRTVAETTFGCSGPDLPEGGSYALVRFRSSFAKDLACVEEVTLEVAPDYTWRVIGYTIQ